MKNTLTKSLIARKEFSFSKKGITLTFNLWTDNSSELKSFKPENIKGWGHNLLGGELK